MISTPELATFGAAVAAIVTFHSGSHTDIMQRICDAAPAGLDLDDRDQARDFCIHYDFDPVALGDTVRVLFDQPTITPRSDVRTAIESYRRHSDVFRAWSEIHANFRSNYLGRRHVLALDTRTGGSVLVPWLGPDALPHEPARGGSTVATRSGVIIAQAEHHTLTY